MKRIIPILIAFVLGAAITEGVWYFWTHHTGPMPFGEVTKVPEGEGWVNLLAEDQRGLWKNITDDLEIFEFDGDMIHIFGKTIVPLRYVGYTGKDFTDFELHLEYKLAPGANSGVFLRIDPDDPLSRGWEIQVLDDFGKLPTKNTSGAIYDVATPMFNLSRPAGEWNSLDIAVRGEEVLVQLNGWLVIHTTLKKMTMPIGKFKTPFAQLPQTGMLALQDHGGEIWYRNIVIREFPRAAEAVDAAE